MKTTIEEIKEAFENTDLYELARVMVEKHGMFDAILVWDPETKSFDVIVESSSTRTPGLHYIARLRAGWNDLVETDDALSAFFDELSFEEAEKVEKLIDEAENLEEISKIMEETTGRDYEYYSNMALIYSVEEWIENSIREFIDTYNEENS